MPTNPEQLFYDLSSHEQTHHIFSKRQKPIDAASVTGKKTKNLKTREELSDNTDKIPS